MNLLCSLLVWSCLSCLLAMPVRAHLCAPSPPNVSHASDSVFCFALGGAT
jgi:hypothetical protein